MSHSEAGLPRDPVGASVRCLKDRRLVTGQGCDLDDAPAWPRAHGVRSEPTGPRSRDMDGVAREYSDALNREVTYSDILPEDWEREPKREGLPAHLTRHLVTMAELNRAGRYDRDLLVREYGLVTVMQARVGLRAHLDGQEMSGDSYLTDVWVTRGAAWQVVARQWSRASAPTAR